MIIRPKKSGAITKRLPQCAQPLISDGVRIQPYPHPNLHVGGAVIRPRQCGDVNIVHVVSVMPRATGDLARRHDMCLSSIVRRDGVLRLGCIAQDESCDMDGWEICRLNRDSRDLGVEASKPFLKDLFDVAHSRSDPTDWLLYTNGDCCVHPDTYLKILSKPGNIVELMRVDVESCDLESIFNFGGSPYVIGLDGLAIRASRYSEIRECLPDFVIGEPHWDTTYSGILRSMGDPVRQEVGLLYHPRHDDTWDDDNLNAAGAHNKSLYRRSVSDGLMPDKTISMRPDKSDIVVVVVFYGNDKRRVEATKMALNKLSIQDLYFDLCVVEMVDESEPRFSDTWGKHVVINSSDKNRDLWQKECLMNIGWRTAAEHDFYVFVDSDVYSEDCGWVRSIRDKLMSDSRNIVQGYRVLQDTQCDDLTFSSLASLEVDNYQTDLPYNPGVCWGMSREMLLEGDGFNPHYIDGGGDSGFVIEYLNTERNKYERWLGRYSWQNEIERRSHCKGKLCGVPHDVVHVNHGPASIRNYEGVRNLLSLMKKRIRDIVRVGDGGLLEWVDPKCPERRMLSQRERLIDSDAARMVYEEVVGDI